MGLPIPSEDRDPWYEDFLAFVNSLDSSLYAEREDRNLLLMRGGTFTFNATSGLLTWADTIELTAPITGFLLSISAGSAVLADKSYLIVDFVRAPTNNFTISTYVSSSVPSTDNTIVLAMRSGSRVYFRNGKVLKDGDSINILEISGGMGASGQLLRSTVTIASGQETALAVPVVAGDFPLRPSDYTISGTTQTIRFMAIASISGGATATVQLIKLDDASTIATFTFTNAIPAKQITSALGLASSECMYEVRYWVSSGTGTVLLGWAGFQIDNTF